MTRRNRRRTTSGAWIEHGTAAPWMHLYAQWLAQQPEAELTPANGERVKRGHRPTTMEREAKATALARRRIDRRLISKLERRPDIRDYFDRMRSDAQFQAAELMRGQIAKAAAARDAALDAASGRIEMPDGTIRHVVQDVRGVDNLTRWVPDLAFPKKLEKENPPPQFVIHLGKDGAKMLGLTPQGLLPADDVTDVEWEAVENPRQLEAGDDDDR